jgi:hypothetical protein
MLKKSASSVLASLRASEVLEGIFRSPRSILWANGHTKCGWYLLASSLAAALLGTRRVSARQGWAGEKSGLFEHPETILPSTPFERFEQHFMHKSSFSADC